MRRFLPIFDWLGSYDRNWLQTDLVAGATVWAVLIPSALAYAGIVGVDPVVGLYTVPLALVGYALFGGSRLLVVGPDAALSVLSAATVAAVLIGGEFLEILADRFGPETPQGGAEGLLTDLVGARIGHEAPRLPLAGRVSRELGVRSWRGSRGRPATWTP